MNCRLPIPIPSAPSPTGSRAATRPEFHVVTGKSVTSFTILLRQILVWHRRHSRYFNCRHSRIDAVPKKIRVKLKRNMGGLDAPKKGGIMLRLASLTVLVLAAASAAMAQFPAQPPPASLGKGNDQERAACHPDVIRYCKAEVDANADDVLGILGCLQRNRGKISRSCQQVLASHGQ